MTDETLVPVETNGQLVYFTVRDLGASGTGAETEIAAQRATLDGVLGGVKAFAERTLAELRDTEVSKVTVEFGCEFALESGSLIAVIGKANSKSVMKVSVEWSNPARQ